MTIVKTYYEVAVEENHAIQDPRHHVGAYLSRDTAERVKRLLEGFLFHAEKYCHVTLTEQKSQFVEYGAGLRLVGTPRGKIIMLHEGAHLTTQEVLKIIDLSRLIKKASVLNRL